MNGIMAVWEWEWGGVRTRSARKSEELGRASHASPFNREMRHNGDSTPPLHPQCRLRLVKIFCGLSWSIRRSDACLLSSPTQLLYSQYSYRSHSQHELHLHPCCDGHPRRLLGRLSRCRALDGHHPVRCSIHSSLMFPLTPEQGELCPVREPERRLARRCS